MCEASSVEQVHMEGLPHVVRPWPEWQLMTHSIYDNVLLLLLGYWDDRFDCVENGRISPKPRTHNHGMQPRKPLSNGLRWLRALVWPIGQGGLHVPPCTWLVKRIYACSYLDMRHSQNWMNNQFGAVRLDHGSSGFWTEHMSKVCPLWHG